jgi:hypothetical protein
MRWFAFACLAILLITRTDSFGVAQMTNTTIETEKMDLGKAPSDFDFGRTGQGTPGKWVVIADATATAGRAIEQSSGDKTDYRFPLAIYRAVSAKNVEVSLRFKPVEGKVDRAGGIAIRVADPDNYYVVRANALEDNVRLYKVVKGRRIQIAGANLKVSAGEWHSLGLKAQDDNFIVTFDGKELYRAADNTLPASGKIALWTKSDSITRFDRIEINAVQP